jgi:hypothetical protein
MGSIFFQSRKGSHKILDSDWLKENLKDSASYLHGFYPGDKLDLSLSIDSDVEDDLIWDTLPGVNIHSVDDFHSGSEQTRATIEFQVVKREHLVTRDWEDRYNLGFREELTTIYVEAICDEGEDLFVRLQEKFKIELRTKLDEISPKNVLDDEIPF